jgi:GTPase Era involved in 16S rRNA processing
MGLFSFLKSDKPPHSDKVWMKKEAALKGMMTGALQALTHGEVPVVLSFFTDKHQEIIEFASSNGVPYTTVDENPANRLTQDNTVLVIDAQRLNNFQSFINFISTSLKPVTFLFYGHYPIPAKENQLLAKISEEKKLQGITFFSSLDDHAFEMFGADNIKNIMQKMGLKEDEAIEHAMVTKAMERAREKIASSVTHEIASSTEVEWYERNYKGGR